MGYWIITGTFKFMDGVCYQKYIDPDGEPEWWPVPTEAV